MVLVDKLAILAINGDTLAEISGVVRFSSLSFFPPYAGTHGNT